MSYRLWAHPWGVELPVAHLGTGREWYRVLYSPQIRNKHHQRASAGMSTFSELSRTVVGSAMRCITGLLVAMMFYLLT